MNQVTSDVAEAWLRRWDAQQERYIADREERFTVLSDIVEAALTSVDSPVILDLGCGPGSLAARMRDRMPGASVIGIDSDPLLLALARAHYGPTIKWVDADLSFPTWQREVPPVIHAAVSTTALHWLPAERLAALYRTLGTLIAPGGVFVNGDHIGLGDARLNALAQTIRERRAARVGVTANEDWRAWWDAINTQPEFAELVEARAQRRNSEDHNENTLSITEHADLLRSAGFSAVSPLWQVGDDHVLVAIR